MGNNLATRNLSDANTDVNMFQRVESPQQRQQRQRQRQRQSSSSSFVHEELPADAVRDLIARGLRPDLSLLPFQMPRMETDGIPPPPVEENTARVRNDMNLHKKSIQLIPCKNRPNCFRIAFDIDAHRPCTLTLFCAVEEVLGAHNATLRFKTFSDNSIGPLVYQLDAGLGQRFQQSESDGIDLTSCSALELHHVPHSHRFPLVIRLERGPINSLNDDVKLQHVQSQTTYADIVAEEPGVYTVKVLKQKIDVGGTFYEVQEIYGLDQNAADNSVRSNDCVICMSAPRTTAILPCRHMCLCYECADILRTQTNKCPICRSAVFKLLRIKVDDTEIAAT